MVLAASLSMLVALLSLAAVVPSASAGDTSTCAFDAATGLLVVRFTAPDAALQISRHGSDILVDREFCGATVLNTDTIHVTGANDSFDDVELMLQEGPLEPGRSPESDGHPEIELELALHGTGRSDADDVSIATSGARDVLTLGVRGMNTNADRDVDIAFGGIDSLYLGAGEGADVISGSGGRGTGRASVLDDLGLTGGPGDDDITGGLGTCCWLDGAEGDDRITARAEGSMLLGSLGDDTLLGSPGEDYLEGGPGRDVLRADDGDDIVVNTETSTKEAAEADVLSGGGGFDRLQYWRADDLSLTLDGLANDGVPGEGDRVMPDFEWISAGGGDDTIVGAPGAQTIDGETGRDDITGGPGRDILYGGKDDDVLHAVDGRRDRLWGGPGLDDGQDRDAVDGLHGIEIA